jgi:hypothetical protein
MKTSIIAKTEKRILITLFASLIICSSNMSQTYTETQILSGNIGESFGVSVAMDGNFAVVGAPYYETVKGCAYVFQNNSGVWTQKAKLTASDGEINDWFGFSVDISGDFIVIGAMQNNLYGSAYIFKKPSSGWKDTTQAAKLTSTDSVFDAKFGWSVSISDNVVLVGSLWDNNKKGSAYVFEKPESGWKDTTQTAKLIASDAADDDQFGNSVSISGDNIVIGACNSTGKGAGYIFVKPFNGWIDTTQTAKLSTSDAAIDDFFGQDVCISGDNVVVGAWNKNQKGSAYVFEKPTSGWADMTQTAILSATDVANSDAFGKAVDIMGDRVLVGAIYNENKGAVYVYEKSINGWGNMTESEKIVASNASNGNYFGTALSSYEDQIMVGDNRAESVYLYSKDNVNTLTINPLSEVNIYPNPAHSNIRIANIEENSTLEIYSIQGRLIKTKELNENDNIVNIEGLNSGSYILKIIKESEVYSDILVIEK